MHFILPDADQCEKARRRLSVREDLAQLGAAHARAAEVVPAVRRSFLVRPCGPLWRSSRPARRSIADCWTG